MTVFGNNVVVDLSYYDGQNYDGSDPVGKTHIREDVVVRIDNRPSFTAFKHKNFHFKVLSGIITDVLTDGQADALGDDVLSEL